MTKQQDIFAAIDRERQFQNEKIERKGWKKNKSPAEYLAVMEGELQEAKEAYLKKTDDEVLKEILQVIAVGVAALEEHGVVERRSDEQ